MEKAAEQGHSAAQWLVGQAYLCGDGALAGKGFKKDNAKAFKFMKAFVEQANFEPQLGCGSPFEALYFIGDAYWSGIGVEINREEAVAVPTAEVAATPVGTTATSSCPPQ